MPDQSWDEQKSIKTSYTYKDQTYKHKRKFLQLFRSIKNSATALTITMLPKVWSHPNLSATLLPTQQTSAWLVILHIESIAITYTTFYRVNTARLWIQDKRKKERYISRTKALYRFLQIGNILTRIKPVIGQRSTYNTVIADPGSPYIATFQCTICFLFTTACSTGNISAVLHFHNSKQRRGDRAALL